MTRTFFKFHRLSFPLVSSHPTMYDNNVFLRRKYKQVGVPITSPENTLLYCSKAILSVRENQFLSVNEYTRGVTSYLGRILPHF